MNSFTKKYKVGIVGFGFVGEAQAYLFSPIADIKIYDIDVKKKTHELNEVLKQDIVFVSLPTPMEKDGKQNLSFLYDFFDTVGNTKCIFVLKSTVLPGTTIHLRKKYNIKIVFSPEFLTEQSYKLDILTQPRIILGGDKKIVKKVLELFKSRDNNKHYVITDDITAEFTKYMNNTFLATKISLLNEFFRVAQKTGVNWKHAIDGFSSDPRVGNSHLNVPGSDGKLGFGGSCFPKDINALINFGNDMGLKFNVLEAAWKTNLEVRPEKDWEKLKKRAVV